MRARVLLESHEAVVDYDPAQCKVEELLAAVGKADGPDMPKQYTATVKNQND